MNIFLNKNKNKNKNKIFFYEELILWMKILLKIDFFLDPTPLINFKYYPLSLRGPLGKVRGPLGAHPNGSLVALTGH